ncbi:MAG: hypothetical protein GC168_15125 [Candidatus Hydrogenedens sp.]|nr:hypothetical protein [Candidatus Hydrogenedens sp.]
MNPLSSAAPGRTWPRHLLRGFGLIAAACLLVLIFSFRGPLAFVIKGGLHLPPPTGPYAVGRVTWDAASPDRPEIFTDDPSDHRRISIDIYYPAERVPGSRSGVYLDAAIAEGVTGLPALLSRPITPNWVEGAPPARTGAPYPVLLFSPGSDSPPVFYTSLLEHVASQGFVVLALWHPYTTARTRFADGGVVESKYAANGAMWEGPDADRDAAKQVVSRVWAEDMLLALDACNEHNAASGAFEGMADLRSVGAFGHSFGGQNAAAAMTLDPRIRAGMNFDGTAVFAPILKQGVIGAFAMVYDDFGPPDDAWLEQHNLTTEGWWAQWGERNLPSALREKAASFQAFQIDGLAHEGFATDLAWLRPLFPSVITEDMVGTIDPALSLALLSDLVGAYFQQHLLDRPSALIVDPSSLYAPLHRGIQDHPDPAISTP